MTVLAVCHDAGGAEIISSWLRRTSPTGFAAVLEGPARAVFARKLGTGFERHPPFPPFAGFDLVLCGSSGAADLERRAIRGARAARVRCAVWLDHWTAYAERFVLDGERVLPDEVWVADPHAAQLAAAQLPGADVRVQGNPYVEDLVAEIRALDGGRTPGAGGERILYVTEPSSVGALRETGDPLGWGYEERDALRRFLEHLAGRAEPPAAVRIRLHPSEPPEKYDAEIAPHAAALRVRRSTGTTLAEDCAWADTVAGCETMAMVVALHAGRRVISVIPPAGRALTLPFPEVERLHRP